MTATLINLGGDAELISNGTQMLEISRSTMKHRAQPQVQRESKERGGHISSALASGIVSLLTMKLLAIMLYDTMAHHMVTTKVQKHNEKTSIWACLWQCL